MRLRSAIAGPRRPSVEMAAPAERLAAFRVVATGFATLYLLVRAPQFWSLVDRSGTTWEPAGLLTPFDGPPPPMLVAAAVLATPVLGVAATVGWRYRATAPCFAVGVLGLTTLRSSWGQLLHFENLIALFALVLAVAPAADAWSMDSRRRGRPPRSEEHADRYGHPLVVAATIVAVTYVIAGLAKLRYGGVGWMDGDTLRNHIASAAARLDLLGGTPAPLAEFAVRAEVVLPAASVLSVVVELAAPVALVDRRLRNLWVGLTWAMHLGILATMAIGFPSPLFGVAFAPLFRLERGVEWITARWRRTGERSVAGERTVGRSPATRH